MSHQFYDFVWEHHFGSPTEKLIMLRLAKHADENGKSWPKIQTLAKFCGVSSRTVQRQIKEFERAGLLEIRKEYRDDGGQTTNRYFITLPSVKAMLPSDRGVIGGVSPTSPLPQTAICHTGDDTAVTPQELPTEAKIEIQQLTHDELQYPARLKASDQVWIIKLLQGVPHQDAQLLLDELTAALSAGRIKGTSSRWFYGLLQNYNKGNFCPLARPSKPEPTPSKRIIDEVEELKPRSEIGASALNILKRKVLNKTSH
ncbi:helix-turn-helix domain-containing protein [Pseudomonas sp. FP818]|uniref:helix-turn-helix domain-containing protein n=1 Tax=Pseudomonas sp. FP818 TaxID=2954099 RepID=UPI002735C12D|nr:helix-turn-helix domain-containing protein [Pseudomonas sp. FP818]WLI34271.1 helix-turn-helix domain-containing protein [Pseudomonas sp. FP818]